MKNKPTYRKRQRFCDRCDELFYKTSKFSRICPSCNKNTRGKALNAKKKDLINKLDKTEKAFRTFQKYFPEIAKDIRNKYSNLKPHSRDSLQVARRTTKGNKG